MNQDPAASPDQEFAAIRTVHGALEPLPPEARSRVVKYIVSLLEIDARVRSPSEPDEDNADEAEETDHDGRVDSDLSYDSFAELHDAAAPKTNADKALVAGYWLQECQGQENFSAQSANKELNHLGEGIGNITMALEALKKLKPAQILQLKKSGKSRQARKTYKVTVAGVRRVQEMVGG